MSSSVTGVDIGGTHITVSRIDLREGVLNKETLVRHSLDPNLAAAATIRDWASAIKECSHLAGDPVDRIGIAMPGPFDYGNGISLITGLSKYESLYGLPIKQLLAEELGIPPDKIRMINDATAYVQGECRMGAAKGDTDVLGLTFGTGLGSAWFRCGKVEDGDLYCFDFRDAKAEDYLSARWFMQTYLQRTGKSVKDVKELAALAENDNEALQLFREFGETIAAVIKKRFAGDIPGTIVLGGNITRSWKFFLPVLQQHLDPLPDIKLASLGESAALIGAAFLWAE